MAYGLSELLNDCIRRPRVNRDGMTKKKYQKVWSALVNWLWQHVVETGKGVRIANFATFSYIAWTRDRGLLASVKERKPVFYLSKKFMNKHGVKMAVKAASEKVKGVTLNYSALVINSGLEKKFVTIGINDIFDCLGTAIAAGESLNLNLKIGVLSGKGNRRVKFTFSDVVHELCAQEITQGQNAHMSRADEAELDVTHRDIAWQHAQEALDVERPDTEVASFVSGYDFESDAGDANYNESPKRNKKKKGKRPSSSRGSSLSGSPRVNRSRPSTSASVRQDKDGKSYIEVKQNKSHLRRKDVKDSYSAEIERQSVVSRPSTSSSLSRPASSFRSFSRGSGDSYSSYSSYGSRPSSVSSYSSYGSRPTTSSSWSSWSSYSSYSSYSEPGQNGGPSGRPNTQSSMLSNKSINNKVDYRRIAQQQQHRARSSHSNSSRLTNDALQQHNTLISKQTSRALQEAENAERALLASRQSNRSDSSETKRNKLVYTTAYQSSHNMTAHNTGMGSLSRRASRFSTNNVTAADGKTINKTVLTQLQNGTANKTMSQNFLEQQGAELLEQAKARQGAGHDPLDKEENPLVDQFMMEGDIFYSLWNPSERGRLRQPPQDCVEAVYQEAKQRAEKERKQSRRLDKAELGEVDYQTQLRTAANELRTQIAEQEKMETFKVLQEQIELKKRLKEEEKKFHEIKETPPMLPSEKLRFGPTDEEKAALKNTLQQQIEAKEAKKRKQREKDVLFARTLIHRDKVYNDMEHERNEKRREMEKTQLWQFWEGQEQEKSKLGGANKK